MSDNKMFKDCANTIRSLSADAIQKAKSGHPGMPLGCADYAFTLWAKYLRHNPANPEWFGRDRFVLSAGHGSMLMYSLLHLFNYGVTIDEIKNFRQWGSRCAGHPEHGECVGIDITTGPLGSGFSSAVGMAMAAKNFAARTGMAGTELDAQRIFVISGDGCLMEGCTSESASLAGHLKLDNIIVFYDDNSITIEGNTNLAFSEDVEARFKSYNWRVLKCDNANSVEECDKVLAEAVKTDGRPTLIIGKTSIGFGAPNKQGKSSAHGEPLGEEEVAAMKANLGLSPESFYVPAEVRAFCDSRVEELKAAAAEYDKKFNDFVNADADRAKLVSALLSKEIPADIKEQLTAALPTDGKPQATRALGGIVLNKAAEIIPSLIGGAADLAPSTKTNLKNGGDFSAADYAARNMHFGIREFGMAWAGNGMALYGSAIPFTSTFFVFSDYMKPAIRLASLMNLKELFIFTHDSFYVGEDGPTHEPIEHLAMFRSLPGVTVFRPAEAYETAAAYAAALQIDGPSVILLTRQNLKPYDAEKAAKIDAAKGAYIIEDEENFDIILIATGSEVNLALDVAAKLREMDAKVRVVSMISQELFLKQDEEYQEEVLPSWCPVKVSIEAASTFGWHRFVGDSGLAIGLDHFGASAPANVLAEKFGFTVDGIMQKIAEYYVIDGEDDECGCSCGDCSCGCDHE